MNRTPKPKKMSAELLNPSRLYDITVHSPKQGGYSADIIEGKIKTESGIFLTTFYREGKSFGAEIYTGSNYIVGSKKRSWSRNYPSLSDLPYKWKLVILRLKEIHDKTSF
jgi:hypothetical protein